MAVAAHPLLQIVFAKWKQMWRLKVWAVERIWGRNTQGNLLRGIDNKTIIEDSEFQFVYICFLLRKHTKENGSKLQFFYIHIIFSKIIFWMETKAKLF